MSTTEPSITIKGRLLPRFDEILTPGALDFIAALDAAFAGRRAELLVDRDRRETDLADRLPSAEFDFRSDTQPLRDADWVVAPPAPGLTWRDCEITGPPTRTMTVHALNCSAAVWMADLEDSTAPTWENVISGQLHLYDAVRGQLDFTAGGRRYTARPISADDAPRADRTPTIMLRPRGWHLAEKHLVRHGRTLPAALVDFGLYFFHNAHALIAAGRGPYFYLPKLESHSEARLWNDVFGLAEDRLGLARGTIRATVLVETLGAAFEMDEILFELREHSAGLNAGRWDYLFSAIRAFAYRGEQFVFPDRASFTMTTPFLRSYTDLLVSTCHRRGAHAIGGMAAFVPDRRDPAATKKALAQVGADKKREANDGFDGSWVAHPDLIETCRSAFAAVLDDRPHQLHRLRPEVHVTAGDLTDFASWAPEVTLEGLRTNIRVALTYLAAWVDGSGAVAIDHLMEDAATVEISRTQVWQWLRYRTRLAEGVRVTPELVARIVEEESRRWSADRRTSPTGSRHEANDGSNDGSSGGVNDAERMAAALHIFAETAQSETLPRFFTRFAYANYLAERPSAPRTTGRSVPVETADTPSLAAAV